jgi:lysine 2,3-aminomutase
MMNSLDKRLLRWRIVTPMKLQFPSAPRLGDVANSNWLDWHWQMRHSLVSEQDYGRVFILSDDERAGFRGAGGIFQIRSTPYYASLASKTSPIDPIRKMLMPSVHELGPAPAQALLDPLGEKQHNPAPRVIHRYPDRVLLLVTDTCSVYCRYCTRKYFTGGEAAFIKGHEYDLALSYIKSHTGIREVILSGGDPLTLSNQILERVLGDLRSIDHVEIIRIGSRMPVVCPMRITIELAQIIRRYQPVYMMTHFNHPRELTSESARALGLMVDCGIPVFNQMVLLNGVNNAASIVQALSRRLLYLRVKPYYMFQCDPSEGSDHLRTSVSESLEIQRELWGRLSGLAMPNLSLDIPGGGGKTGLVPNFEVEQTNGRRSYVGWDGVRSEYIDPNPELHQVPSDAEIYQREWDDLKGAKQEVAIASVDGAATSSGGH